MRARALGVCLALSAWGALPAGLSRLPIAEVAHHHRLYPEAGKLLYVEGEFPYKTNLGIYDLAAGKARSFHFAEYRLPGRFLYLPELGQALVEGRTQHEILGAAEADETRLLLVSLADGSVLREVPLGRDAVLAAFGRPAWSKQAFLLLVARDRTFLKVFDPATGTLSDAAAVGDFAARRAVFDENAPLALLDVKAAERARLVVYDLAARKAVRDFPSETGFDELAAAPEGVLARFQPPGEAKGVIVALDLARGSSRELARVDGELECMLPAGGRVYAVAQDPGRPPKDAEKDLRARVLAVVDASRPGSLETVPWTQRKGRFFGFDARSGRLYFAATQPSSAWAIAAERGALADAARELDRRTGEFWGRAADSWIAVLLVLVVAGAALLVRALRPPCKRCR